MTEVPTTKMMSTPTEVSEGMVGYLKAHKEPFHLSEGEGAVFLPTFAGRVALFFGRLKHEMENDGPRVKSVHTLKLPFYTYRVIVTTDLSRETYSKQIDRIFGIGPFTSIRHLNHSAAC